MKYQVGDLVETDSDFDVGLGYISDIKEKQKFIFITWFKEFNTQKVSFDYFEIYFKVVSHVSISSR
jgi:hypothetical protein